MVSLCYVQMYDNHDEKRETCPVRLNFEDEIEEKWTININMKESNMASTLK